jgi:hypothetical protein
MVIDVRLVRDILRVLRPKYFSSSRKAAAAAGINPSTVAKLENLKTWPDYDPGIGIILAMLRAMEIPFQVFVEHLDAADLSDESSRLNRPYSDLIADASDRYGRARQLLGIKPADTVQRKFLDDQDAVMLTAQLHDMTERISRNENEIAYASRTIDELSKILEIEKAKIGALNDAEALQSTAAAIAQTVKSFTPPRSESSVPAPRSRKRSRRT